MKGPKKTSDMRAYHREWYARRTEAQKERRRATRRAYYRANPKKTRERLDKIQSWRDRNRARIRHHNLKRYGITPDEFDGMLGAQGGRCANQGCATTEPGHQGFHVDHDHGNGRVRGLLCGHCNKALGFARDNPAILLGLVGYLKQHAA